MADALTGSSKCDYVLEEQVGFLLRRAAQRNTSIFTERMAEFGLTPRQFALLVKIRDEAPISQNRVGRLAHMDRATAQGVVRRLIERGLVIGSPDPSDRRRHLLKLTEPGQALIRAATRRAHQVTSENLAPLKAGEAEDLIALLRKIC